jgi:hypothetical protein
MDRMCCHWLYPPLMAKNPLGAQAIVAGSLLAYNSYVLVYSEQVAGLTKNSGFTHSALFFSLRIDQGKLLRKKLLHLIPPGHFI